MESHKKPGADPILSPELISEKYTWPILTHITLCPPPPNTFEIHLRGQFVRGLVCGHCNGYLCVEGSMYLESRYLSNLNLSG